MINNGKKMLLCALVRCIVKRLNKKKVVMKNAIPKPFIHAYKSTVRQIRYCVKFS